jgi:hypothetical protein
MSAQLSGGAGLRARRVKVSAVLVALMASIGCGPEPLNASFTSRVVQRDVCRVVGARPEVCEREEASLDVKVQIVELEDNHVWLYGIPRNGASDRAIFGTKDSRGGYLFSDVIEQENSNSGCVLRNSLEISVVIDEAAPAESIGVDPCIPLVGRETEVTFSSAGCDDINVPPLDSTLTARRRWEKPPECTP